MPSKISNVNHCMSIRSCRPPGTFYLHTRLPIPQLLYLYKRPSPLPGRGGFTSVLNRRPPLALYLYARSSPPMDALLLHEAIETRGVYLYARPSPPWGALYLYIRSSTDVKLSIGPFQYLATKSRMNWQGYVTVTSDPTSEHPSLRTWEWWEGQRGHVAPLPPCF